MTSGPTVLIPSNGSFIDCRDEKKREKSINHYGKREERKFVINKQILFAHDIKVEEMISYFESWHVWCI
jgi:hypothetical protein